jgi:hypothetical protein
LRRQAAYPLDDAPPLRNLGRIMRAVQGVIDHPADIDSPDSTQAEILSLLSCKGSGNWNV